MMWLFFSAVVFLFGTEVAATVRQSTGSGGEMATKKSAFAAGTRH
jgi:uncharacterized BrkB/YihY/UPF0761 family membrane protein